MMVSRRVPTGDGGFTLDGLTKTSPKHYLAGGSSTFGNAELDQEPLLFSGLDYGYLHEVAIGQAFTGVTKYDGAEDALKSGLFISVTYDQDDIDDGDGELAPLIYGAYIEAVGLAAADGNAGFEYIFGAQIIAAAESEGGIFQLMGVLGDANLAGETTGSDGNVTNAIGVNGTVDSETGFTGDVTTAISIQATSNLQNAIDVTTYQGVKVETPQNGGGIVNGYGIYIAEMTKGTTQKWNLFSAGTSSKNKLEGRLMQGAPNSAPTDGDLGNGQISAYLDQAGNALKFRVKYSDGTLKTGSVSLT